METIVALIDEALVNFQNDDVLEGISVKVNEMMSERPLFAYE